MSRVRVNMKSTSSIIAAKGLAKNGCVQKFVTHEAKRLMDLYVPMLSGTLKNTAVESTSAVTYNQPYAKRQYYEHKGRGMRGPRWDRRMVATRGQELVRATEAYAKR